MLREGLKMSPKINALSDRAECLFTRLLTTVDDGGVYYSDPKLVNAAVWPLKSYRIADVALALDQLERAGLIARWTDKDGSRYLCLLRFRQKLKFPRRRYPKPPFDDTSGQIELLQPDEPPEPETPPPPPLQKEKKRREGRGPTADAATPAPESFEQALARLRAAHPGIDIEAELEAARRKKAKEGRELELGWFEKSWLPNCTPKVTAAQIARVKSAPAVETDEPEGWRDVVKDSEYGPGGNFEAKSWSALPTAVKKWVREQLTELAKS